MSNGHGITAENLLRTLPTVLADDLGMEALAQMIAGAFGELATKPQSISIYTRIDTLDEALLDTLAYDFKVDWWNPDYTLEEKRRTLKDSWYVHRHLGTKSAVERAISAIYEGSTVAEWPSYDGRPYHFKLRIPVDQGTLDPDKHAKVLSLIRTYKNLRSVLDVVEYYGSSSKAPYYVGAIFAGSETIASATAR